MGSSNYLKKVLESFTIKTNKIKDNKIIALNILNKRLIENTNYEAEQLWVLQDLERVMHKMMGEYDITRYQAAEKLKALVKSDETIWRLNEDEQFFKKNNK